MRGGARGSRKVIQGFVREALVHSGRPQVTGEKLSEESSREQEPHCWERERACWREDETQQDETQQDPGFLLPVWWQGPERSTL